MFITGEDDWGDTIRPRFEDVGGDTNRFFAVKGVIERDEQGEVSLGVNAEDIGELNRAAGELKPRLLVIDPFQAFIGAKVDFHRANEVRPVMEALKRLAEQHQCAIVLIRHLSKAVQSKDTYRGIGSIDILAAARSVLMTGTNPLPLNDEEFWGLDLKTGMMNPQPDKTRFAFVPTKNNVAQRGSPIAYGIRDGKLIFSGPVELTGADLGQQVLKPKMKPRVTATAFLLELLSREPVPAVEVFRQAAKLNLSDNTVRRAANELSVQKKPDGFGKQWLWSLPIRGEKEERVSCAGATCDDSDERSTHQNTDTEPVSLLCDRNDSQSDQSALNAEEEIIAPSEQFSSINVPLVGPKQIRADDLAGLERAWADAEDKEEITAYRQAYLAARAQARAVIA